MVTIGTEFYISWQNIVDLSRKYLNTMKINWTLFLSFYFKLGRNAVTRMYQLRTPYSVSLFEPKQICAKTWQQLYKRGTQITFQ